MIKGVLLVLALCACVSAHELIRESAKFDSIDCVYDFPSEYLDTITSEESKLFSHLDYYSTFEEQFIKEDAKQYKDAEFIYTATSYSCKIEVGDGASTHFFTVDADPYNRSGDQRIMFQYHQGKRTFRYTTGQYVVDETAYMYVPAKKECTAQAWTLHMKKDGETTLLFGVAYPTYPPREAQPHLHIVPRGRKYAEPSLISAETYEKAVTHMIDDDYLIRVLRMAAASIAQCGTFSEAELRQEVETVILDADHFLLQRCRRILNAQEVASIKAASNATIYFYALRLLISVAAIACLYFVWRVIIRPILLFCYLPNL